MDDRYKAAIAKLERAGVIEIVGYNEAGQPIVRLSQKAWELMSEVSPPTKKGK